MTIRVGRRRLTLSWRARKALPALLTGLLRRSWRRVLAPVLRVSVAAAAVCGAWQTQALAAAPAAGTLPAGWSVVNGNVVFTQNGNTLNINQTTAKAIANFSSFSIGSGAVVNISQPGAAAAFLAKVTGGDISQIYGKLTAPGTVVLYNPNGLVIGAGGMVDVGRFIGTTLNINNDDFLAGKLTFFKDGTAGAVSNQGTIKSATGGSVYLIGGSVSNGGIIQSPQGEVILAAGETVTLADTATPGVTVNVTGSTGNVTNLGTITAEAGRIGIAAGLITNSGSINASSVVREGGRIFLRATSNLTTTATSSISADGTVGGNVTLYAQNKAFIDGDVSATGAPGHGGFVETSGLKQLDVVKVPTVGSGGTWLIDPYDLTVVSSSTGPIQGGMCGTVYAVGSSDGGTEILNSTINAQLNQGVNVTLTTGNGGNSGNGDITINADIVKSAGAAANLTLNADNNININANITSSSNGLDLALNTRHNDYSEVPTVSRNISINNGARVVLNGGTMTVSDGGGRQGNGSLVVGNGSIVMGSGDVLNAGNVSVSDKSSLSLNGTAFVNVSSLSNNGTVSGNGSITTTGGFTNNGTLAPGGDGAVGTLNISGPLTFSSASKLLLDFSSSGNDKINILTGSAVNLGGTLKTRLLNGYTAAAGTVYQVFNMTADAQFSSYFRNVTGDVLTVGGNKQMIKAISNGSSLTLAMTGSETLTISGGEGGYWDSLSTWGGYIPTEIDTVAVGSGVTLQHSSGTDTVDKLVLNGGSMNVSGGNLTVATSASGSGSISLSSSVENTGPATALTLNNAVTDANITVNGGNLLLGGKARFFGLAMNGGTVTGNAGSSVVVSDAFSQIGGSITLDNGALSQASGTLTVGNITANNLVLEAQSGNITQNDGTTLRVTKQLIASAVDGIDLANANATNNVAAFAAANRGLGDIKLLNHLRAEDTSVVTINGVTAANGNISIENYGAMATTTLGSNGDFLANLPVATDGTTTGAAVKLAMLGIDSSGQVKAAGTGGIGSVNMSTHSPLTIGSPGVISTGGITLAAGTAPDGGSVLTINGMLVTLGNNIVLTAGDRVQINANISTTPPGVVLRSALSGAVVGYAAGVTITDVNGTVTPVPVSADSTTPSASQKVISQQQNQTTQNLLSVINTIQLGATSLSTSSAVSQSSTKDSGKNDDKMAAAEDRTALKSPSSKKMYCN